jgi:hypothetical protein
VNGYDPNVQNFLGSTAFSVDVVTPEPSGLTLIFMGATLLFLSRALKLARSR